MTTSYSTNLALALPVQGTESGTWGTTVNSSITNMLDEALGYQTYPATGGADTITIPNGTTGVARSIYIQLNGTGGGSVAVPASRTKMYFVFNNTGSAIQFKVTGQTGVSIPVAAKIALVSNGTDIIVAENYLAALTLGAALPVASGGTGTITPNIVAGANVTVSGTWPNQTIAASSAAQVYPGAGIANSTGTAWGTSYTTSGSGTVVALNNTPTLTNPTVTNYTETPYSANSSTAITLDLTNGTVQIITLTGNATITMPAVVSGKSFTLLLKQDATGSRTVTWSTVSWPSATAPTITSIASRMDKYVFISDGTYWYGATAGQNYT